jgi:1-aminocyclopropane-1-carboxylate deaminase/D-cysteine desulfhydrase-like pyridoxal-dependent ACC family enzyme
MIKSNTPIKEYKIGNHVVHVKREDLCVPPNSGWPSFAKIRGLHAHMMKLKRRGIEAVGYPDNKISMAGWGVAAVAKELGMKAFIFHHDYKVLPEKLKYHRKKWLEFGADVVPLYATKQTILSYSGANFLQEKFKEKAVMLPMGLPFPETVIEVSKIARRSKLQRFNSIVVCIGSGTMCAGILRGAHKSMSSRFYGIMVKHVEEDKLQEMRRDILDKAGLKLMPVNFIVENSDYQYEEEAKIDCPFPSHPIYDLKAWEWLVKNIDKLKAPICYWNVGSDPYQMNR